MSKYQECKKCGRVIGHNKSYKKEICPRCEKSKEKPLLSI